jgi:hypothetical protein
VTCSGLGYTAAVKQRSPQVQSCTALAELGCGNCTMKQALYACWGPGALFDIDGLRCELRHEVMWQLLHDLLLALRLACMGSRHRLWHRALC